MAKSLSAIMGQIEKLQKQAAAIQSGVIARIKKEIAQHGLLAEHLFGSEPSKPVAEAKPAKRKVAGATRSPKFADDKGNTWGGMGKRPQWIRDALEAGQSLDEFLVAGKKSGPVAKAAAKSLKRAAPAKKRATTKKTVAAKKAVKPAGTAPGRKVAAKKTRAKRVAKTAATATPVAKA